MSSSQFFWQIFGEVIDCFLTGFSCTNGQKFSASVDTAVVDLLQVILGFSSQLV